MPPAYSLPGLLLSPPPHPPPPRLSSQRKLPPPSSFSSPLRLPTLSLPLPRPIRRTRRITPLVARDSNSALEQTKDEQRVGSDIGTLLRRFWKVAAPYWSSEDKIQARLRLAGVFALTLGTTGISVGFNFLGRDFYNALANKDQEQFTKQLLYYLGAFAGGIPVFVLRDYAREILSLRWRSWMTSYYMERYLKNQTFYKIQSQSIIDNPDQRIVDDLSSFTGTALSFSLTLFNAVVDLISFSNILYGIYPPLFVVLLVYSIGGTAISVVLGKDLVTLNFMQEKKEADFRYGLVRVRENAESIAFYGGEGNELQLLLERFRRAFENLSKLLISSRNLEFFTNGYRYLIQILPAAVVAPMYFSGKIEFGVINQSVSAFNHILGDFSLIVYQFQAISAFSAVIDRLGEFDDILDGTNSSYNLSSDTNKEITIVYNNKQVPSSLYLNGSVPLDGHRKLLEIQHLTLQTPSSNNVLITDLSLDINIKDHLLVMGPSGSGKTSFLRALAGLWSTGKGNITFYVGDFGLCRSSMSSDVAPESMNATEVEEFNNFKSTRSRNVFFLPQRPYMVLGSLRQQLLYPTWCDGSLNSLDNVQYAAGTLPFLYRVSSSEDVSAKPREPTVDDMIHVLEVVRLGDILSRFNGLDSIYEWSSVLSLGEQQRLAFARLLLSKPELILLDEATSALDDANELWMECLLPTYLRDTAPAVSTVITWLLTCGSLGSAINNSKNLYLKKRAHLYRQIEAAGITYVSIGHRRTLYNYHNRVLQISKFDPEKPSQRNWFLESIGRTTINEVPKPAQ